MTDSRNDDEYRLPEGHSFNEDYQNLLERLETLKKEWEAQFEYELESTQDLEIEGFDPEFIRDSRREQYEAEAAAIILQKPKNPGKDASNEEKKEFIEEAKKWNSKQKALTHMLNKVKLNELKVDSFDTLRTEPYDRLILRTLVTAVNITDVNVKNPEVIKGITKLQEVINQLKNKQPISSNSTLGEILKTAKEEKDRVISMKEQSPQRKFSSSNVSPLMNDLGNSPSLRDSFDASLEEEKLKTEQSQKQSAGNKGD